MAFKTLTLSKKIPMAAVLDRASLAFLQEIAKNNNRSWFEAHKETFKEHQNKVKAFFGEVALNMTAYDEIEKMKMFRIYRDVRFSKDKSPYKTQFAASFSRAGAQRRGGRFICIKPGGSFIAAGFWNPNKEDLFRIRKELELDASEFREVIDDPIFSEIWGDLGGEAVKTAPKGFDKNHPDIELIRFKQFIFTKYFTDSEVLSKDFLSEIDTAFKAVLPFFDLMGTVLTTNLNGESLIG